MSVDWAGGCLDYDFSVSKNESHSLYCDAHILFYILVCCDIASCSILLWKHLQTCILSAHYTILLAAVLKVSQCTYSSASNRFYFFCTRTHKRVKTTMLYKHPINKEQAKRFWDISWHPLFKNPHTASHGTRNKRSL